MLLDQPIPRHITGLYVFAMINLMALFHLALVEADVNVKESNVTLHMFADMPASFGALIPAEGITGYLILVQPVHGCDPIARPPFNGSDIKWFAIVRRGGCDFSKKVLNAQKSGFLGVIVYNNDSDKLLPMAGGDKGYAVDIQSVFIGRTDGMTLSDYYCYHPAAKIRYTITIDGHKQYPGDYAKFLYPFAIVVGCCFILMVIFMVGKWCRDVRKRRRSRLSKRHLNKLQVKKFKKGDDYEVCAICLDEYEEGEKLRILPCNHAYHCKCIDPWLTKNKRVCPICKRRVFPELTRDSDSDTDGEDNGNETASERTPLLGGGEASGSGTSRRSTFDNSGLPAAVAQECDGHANAAATLEDETTKDNDDSSTNSVLEGAVGGQAIAVETCIEVEACPPDRISQCSNTGSINSAEGDIVAIVPSPDLSPTREDNKQTSFVV